MWTSAWKKNYSYHICEIYSDNFAVCLYLKVSFCLYSIGNVWNAIISNIVFTRMFFMLFSNRVISFFTLQCECSQVVMFQIMPALCPHGQWEGERGWSTKCGQIWTGGGGVPRIPKFVQTSFMDDPLWNLDNVVRCFFLIHNSNFSKNLSKSSPISIIFWLISH